MKAIYYEQFCQPPVIAQLPDPSPSPTGVVIQVGASGLCRSDWHGWRGHDADITLPHVPGHELAGTIVACGAAVRRWQPGARVTLPFVGGCGHCTPCQRGQQQVCDQQFQPGFTHWGSFAEYVAIDYADNNLVALPDTLDEVTAASLGCRFATAFRAVVTQGAVRGGDWVAVHGCGGVGLSAIMIAHALGAQCIAIDIKAPALALARELGACATIDASAEHDVAAAIIALTAGGAQVSLDALGSASTCINSIACLATHGKHIQVGLLAGADYQPRLPMEKVIAKELQLIGSHGLAAHSYPAMLRMISNGQLQPQRLIQQRLTLEQALPALINMDQNALTGVSVIDRF